MRFKMSYGLLTTLLIISALFLTSCGSVDDTLNKFCNSLLQGDYPTAYMNDTSISYKQQVSEAGFVSNAQSMLGSNASSCKAINEHQNDSQNSGSASITATSANGTPRMAIVLLVYENGNWLISSITLR